MKTLTFIHANLDQYRTKLYLNILAAFMDGCVAFAIPILLAEFTKTDLSFGRFSVLVPYLIACFLASLVLQWIIRRWGEALAKQFGNYLRLKCFKIIERVDAPVLLEHHTGYLLSLVTKVCEGSTGLVFTMIWLLAHSCATLALFFIFTARESLLIAVLNAVVLVVFLFISVLFSRKMVPIAERLNILHARLIESFVDLMTNVFTIKKLGIFEFAEATLEKKVDSNYEQIQALQNFHSNRWFVLHAIYGIAFLSTITFLLYQISAGFLSASVLILFISAFATIRSHVERLSEMIKDVLELDAYVNSLNEVTAHVSDRGHRPTSFHWQEISFRNISFAYEQATKAIRVPAFHLKRGEVICIRGESGQGKSTFIDLLACFLQPQSGQRLLNGEPYESYSPEVFRSMLSVVSQEVELFNISVRDNICLGQSIADVEIVRVLESLRLGAWLAELPEGLDTLVGEKGLKLSAGQKQRINIARGVLLDRDILLLDEPTSHLDVDTEKIVVDYLGKCLKDKTAVFISHRPAIEKICGRKFIFEQSCLQEA